jgi:hypothetical protein
MKIVIFRKLFVTFILSITLVLSACAPQPVFTDDDTPWINETQFAQGRTFLIANVDASITEETVYRVEDEVELALLVFIQNLETLQPIFYISEQELDMDVVYAYLESVLPYSFVLNIKSYTYSHQNEILLILFEMNIEPVMVELQGLRLITQHWSNQLIQANQSYDQMIKAIHDGIILRTAYDESVLELDLTVVSEHLSFEAYGLMTTGLAVCSGYARAFNALAHLNGIPSIMISAVNMQHAFNMVYNGNEWVFMDVTFNDPIPDRPNRIIYTFYMLNERDFLALDKHRFDEAGEGRLTLDQYRAFAYALYPQTRR